MEVPKHEVGDELAAPAPAAAVRGGGLATLLHRIELEDRRIQASAFFLIWGCCVMLHGTVLNLSDNPEHVLAGYVLYTIGAGLAFLTLSGAGSLGRAAARMEEKLRGYF